MKVIPLRLGPGDDLGLALEDGMGLQGEQAGCLISGIGSLSVARIRLPEWTFRRELDPATGWRVLVIELRGRE
jgi:hypothetical protein